MIIPIAEPDLDGNELNNVTKALKSGWISSKGEYIVEFENKFANYCNSKFGIATSNGTTALHLALKAMGVQSGDEIILPALTFIATANVINYCNAKPVFVDIHPKNWCIDPIKIKEKITKNTKGIILVHLYGHPCEMDFIKEIATDHDLWIIEDAAEAHGAEYRGKKVGSFGEISCFSFFGNKIITTGEGGMCLTNGEDLSNKMRIMRDHGMDPNRKYWHPIIGYNYRMTNVQAAIGVAQLSKLDRFIEKKRKIASWYNEEFNELIDKEEIFVQKEESWAKSVFWLYSLRVKNESKNVRDQLIDILAENKIESRPIFNTIPDLPPYRKFGTLDLINSRMISKNGLSLPSSTKLYRDQVNLIGNIIKKFLIQGDKQ